MNSFYYSPGADGGAGAFFSTDVHGTRTVDVVDQVALSTALAALTAEEFADDANADDVAERRSALLSNPPIKTVPNPECRVPEDAVEISAEDHARLIEGQSAGLLISWSATARRPVLGDRPVDVERLIAGVKRERDRLLRESDWTQLPDNEMGQAARKAWREWRQRVREACRQFEFATDEQRPDLNNVFPLDPFAGLRS